MQSLMASVLTAGLILQLQASIANGGKGRNRHLIFTRPFHSTYHSISFYTDSNWIIGNEGEPCNSVCAKTNRSCSSLQQSKMTTKDLFEDALKEAGHQSCQKFVHRPYSGAPLMANDGTTCVYLTPGAKSVCHEVKYPDHRPLCYCGKFFSS